MLRNLGVAGSICATISFPAYAVTDVATGLSVEPPAPFVATIVDEPGAASMISVSSTTGAPRGIDGDPAACVVTFRVDESNASLTQDEINELAALPEIMNLTKAGLELAFELSDPVAVTVSGVTAIEFEGSIKAGATQGGTPLYTASMQTPRGVTMLLCFTSPEEYQMALPQFRAIRDSITPPQ